MNSEKQYNAVKARLLSEERKLIDVLAEADFLLELRQYRERIIERIERDDSTLAQRDLVLSFSSNQIDRVMWTRLLDQEGKCRPLRAEWCALVQLKNNH
jgi:hypothetical protein